MKKYNHAFTIAFAINTNATCENDNDYPTPTEIRTAIEKRISSLPDDELMEAVGVPFDTYENE